MKTLIVYYSKTGNTQRVASDLAKELDAVEERLVDTKDRSGFLGYFVAGYDAMKKKLTEIRPVEHDPSEYDLVLLGMPVWGWNMNPALRTYAVAHKDKIREYAFFVTSGNTDAEKLKPHFAEVLGREPMALVGFSGAELKDAGVYREKLGSFVGRLRSQKRPVSRTDTSKT